MLPLELVWAVSYRLSDVVMVVVVLVVNVVGVFVCRFRGLVLVLVLVPGALVPRGPGPQQRVPRVGANRWGAVNGQACHAGRARRMRGDPPKGGPRQLGVA